MHSVHVFMFLKKIISAYEKNTKRYCKCVLKKTLISV